MASASATIGGILAVIISVTACSSSLPVEPAVGAQSQFCIELGSILPVSLDNALLRSTRPDSPSTAAWGDPAIVMRCGVPTPSSYSPASQIITVDKLDWYPEELEFGVRFTTLTTPELIEISIPSTYESSAEILTQLGVILGSNNS